MAEPIPGGFQAPMEEKEKTLQAIEITKDKVIVMGVEVSRNPEPGPRTPNAEKFKDFVLDEFSLDLLQKIAKTVYLNQPMLLEGGAAIGKSHTIEYLAYLANQEVYRMSLNGQTDTTDLIGKWIPRTEEYCRKIEEIIVHPEKCQNSRSRELIQSKQIKASQEAQEEAKTKGQTAPIYFGFSKEEMMAIANLEGIDVSESDWIWQDGEMPREIENGAWTVLDEANTCEPQVLVRLNAILERGGELVLQENGGKVVKPKNPNKTHRMFITANPPGGRYRGRVPFSAEWISRLNYQNIGELPKETAKFRAKLKAGCSLKLEIEKLKDNFIQPEGIPEDLTLAEVFGNDWASDFCDKYIEAFYTIREMVTKDEIGRDQEQKFDFDQRDWIRFEEYVKKFAETGKINQVIEDAVGYSILGKIKNPNDKTKVRQIILDLIKVNEPEIKKELSQQSRAKELNRVKIDLLSIGIPEEHKKLLMEL